MDEEGWERIERALKEHFWSGSDTVFAKDCVSADQYCQTAEGQDAVMRQRQAVGHSRSTRIPWLSAARPLDGARVLEVGTGTGNGTVALAEQGAVVTSVDLHEPSQRVASERCRAYGVEAEFKNVNAAEIDRMFEGQVFDIVFFSGCLEHMLIDERIASLRAAWELIPDNGLCVIGGTPNRLWLWDAHTARLPFFNWLPDDLAYAYSRFSPREPFCSAYRVEERTPETFEHFLRWGRGMSYHELDLALRDATTLEVVSSIKSYQRSRSPFLALAWMLTVERRYQRALMAVGPKLHSGFYEANLNIILRKTPAGQSRSS